MNYSVFIKNHLFIEGDLKTVIVAIKTAFPGKEALLIETETCKRLDINWYGNTDDVLQRLENTVFNNASTSDAISNTLEAPVKKRGRPKLGVTSKEVTLLPRHWEWLTKQSGGASATLRRLIDEARKKHSLTDDIKMRQQQLFGFINIFAEELEHVEEAIRSLYRQDREGFIQHTKTWPVDIQQFCATKFSTILTLEKTQSETQI